MASASGMAGEETFVAEQGGSGPFFRLLFFWARRARRAAQAQNWEGFFAAQERVRLLCDRLLAEGGEGSPEQVLLARQARAELEEGILLAEGEMSRLKKSLSGIKTGKEAQEAYMRIERLSKPGL